MTTPRQAPSTQVYRVYIKAPAQAVWTAITDPAWTQRYGYGGRGEYDLRPGGTYQGWTSDEMRAMGAPDLAVDGEILEADPPNRLVQTFRMVMDERMRAEGFTRLTYELAEDKHGVTRLTLTHELGDSALLAKLLAGGMEDEGAGGGWAWVLSDLKSVLETGSGFDKSP